MEFNKIMLIFSAKKTFESTRRKKKEKEKTKFLDKNVEMH